MFKFITLLAIVAGATAQVLQFSPLTLGSSSAAQLQTIQLTRPSGVALARPNIALRAPIAVAAPAIQHIAAPQHFAIAAAPLQRQAILARPAPIALSQPILREESYPPQPYTYGFSSTDEYGTQQSRQEQADGSGSVTGSYSLVDPDGRQRVVEYVADGAGFRATVRTNEPGTANANPADVEIQSTAPTRR
ncbi:larval cuticle protein A3A-like [Oppia nitens]|uniref:larval cuticle protein A3A-like n=1 Tax=Oppia nitens TaxID=1686743 RepID=UPI0023DAFC21|nr:larval cuticle protein A3A-like [Oppia nitens]